MRKLLLILLFIPCLSFGQVVAYYRLNGDATDASGAGLNGTAVGTPSYVQGVATQAVSVDKATPKYVDLGTPAALELYTNFTVIAWISTTTTLTGGDVGFCVSKDYSTGARGWGMGMFNDQKGYLEVGGSQRVKNAGPTLNDGKWHQIATTKNGTAWAVYVDGVQIGTYTGSLTANSSAKWYINGRHYTGVFSGMVQNIDEVQFYSSAMTAAQIKNEYSVKKGFFR